jgi:PKD repeat protein
MTLEAWGYPWGASPSGSVSLSPVNPSTTMNGSPLRLAFSSSSSPWTAALAAIGLLLCGSTAARAQNAGWGGPSFDSAESFPTGSKPESKLWWNDGIWWGCLWSEEAQSFTIHRLLARTETWLDTGIAVDSRPKSRADCLWDGTKLYIASHEYTDGVGGPGHALELYRYSYDPHADRYALDVGFPAVIGDAKTEALVIDEDSTGTLWAVWRAGSRVWFASTRGDDRSWSAPQVHPRSTSSLDEDDLASVVSFDGKIGVLWSDQVLDAYRFTFHEDGSPATTWSPLETVLSVPADDDISLRAARDGRVFVALSTHAAEVRLEVRSTTGTWTDHLVARNADDWCNPVLVLDEEDATLHVFGTTPIAQGAIHEKVAAMDAPVFAAGLGTPVIRVASRPALGEPTSTKQSVSSETGLVVLASHHTLRRYAHHHDSLGGPRPSVPVAVFHADPRAGFQPLRVQFLDASTGLPSNWAWTFGDGATSTQRNPVHTYTQAGQYSVSLRVSNGLGSDLQTRADFVRVDAPPTSLVVRAIADSDAYEGTPDTNRGGLPTLRIRGGRSSDYRSFVKFFVPPMPGQITSAEFVLGVVDDSSEDDGAVYRVSDDWGESTLTWDHMPSFPSNRIGDFGNATTGSTIGLDVSSAVRGSGTVSFGLRSTDFHSATYAARESDVPPELRLTLVQPFSARPEPRFESNRSSGTAPLAVQFFDASSGLVDSWTWDFGDGATSDLQNPSHTYALPGSYAVSLTVTNSRGATARSESGSLSVQPRAPRAPAPLAPDGPEAAPIPATSSRPASR